MGVAMQSHRQNKQKPVGIKQAIQNRKTQSFNVQFFDGNKLNNNFIPLAEKNMNISQQYEQNNYNNNMNGQYNNMNGQYNNMNGQYNNNNNYNNQQYHNNYNVQQQQYNNNSNNNNNNYC